MPTKPSSWGIQEYVPKGNGDASGEYADDQGNNMHFTNFVNPNGNEQVDVKNDGVVDKPVEQPPIEQPKEEPKVEGPKEPNKGRFDELSQKQKFEIAKYILKNCNGKELYEDIDYLTDRLKSPYSRDRFGDLSNFSDDDLKDIINYIASQNKGSGEYVWFKDKGSWYMTDNTTAFDLSDTKYYTADEKVALENEKARKIVEKSQNEQDKQIQSMMGKNTVVCFGKGYSKEDLDSIVKDTETFVKDFPELKDYIKVMGDVTNAERLINAKRKSVEPSEEEIQEKMDYVKKVYYYPDGNEAEKEKWYRNKAISLLTREVKFTKLRNAYAYWSDSDKAMLFMPKMRDVTSEQLKREYDTNFKSSDKRNSVFCHEIGHAVDFNIESMFNAIWKRTGEDRTKDGIDFHMQLSRMHSDYRNKINSFYNQNYNNGYREEYDKLYEQKSSQNVASWAIDRNVRDELSEKGIKKYNISEYGGENNKEFVAECFAAHYTGMNNPLATQVVNTMLEYANSLRSFL